MYKCFICEKYHTLFNDKKCSKIFDTLINNCKKIDLTLIKFKIKEKIKNERFKCDKCGIFLSNITNYKNHINKNVCNKKEKIFECKKCGREFPEKRNLVYHTQHAVCENRKLDPNKILISKTKKKSNQNNIKVQQVPNQTNQSIQPQITQTTHNIQTQNNIQNQSNIQTQNNTQNIQNQNNIIISVNSQNDLEKVVEMLPFRNASYNIPAEKYLEYANNPEQAIKKFIKDYHFNPDKPERMNILNTNRRDNRVQLFDFDDDFVCRWLTAKKSIICELLYDRGVNNLFFAKANLSRAGIKLDPKKEAHLNEKIKEYGSNDVTKKKYIDMISDLTYDYRDVVETNKKKHTKQFIEN